MRLPRPFALALFVSLAGCPTPTDPTTPWVTTSTPTGTTPTGTTPTVPTVPADHEDITQRIDLRTDASDATLDWSITVQSDHRYGVRLKDILADEAGNLVVAGEGKGVVRFGDLWTWQAPVFIPSQLAFVVQVDALGGALWESIFRITDGDSDSMLSVQRVTVDADGASLVSLTYRGELLLPDGAVKVNAGTDAALLVRLSPQGRIQWTTQIQLASPTSCPDLARLTDGFGVACYGGAGVGLALRLDDAGEARWETDFWALPADTGYAYLFQTTDVLHDQVYGQVWSSAGFETETFRYEAAPNEADSFHALNAQTGEVAWSRPADAGMLAVEPHSATLLVGSADAAGTHIMGLDPVDGEPLWTVDHLLTRDEEFENLAFFAFSPTRANRWLLSGMTSTPVEAEGRRYSGLLLEADPADAHRMRRLLVAEGMFYASHGHTLVDDNSVVVTVAGFDAPLQVFGTTLTPPAAENFDVIVKLDWPLP